MRPVPTQGKAHPPTSWLAARRQAHHAGLEARALQQRNGRDFVAAQEVSLLEALGRYLAAAVTTEIPLPHYDSAAMDGWALYPDARKDPQSPRRAVPIRTGGLIPESAELVLPVEHGIDCGDGTVKLNPDAPSHALSPGRHIREAGTEARAGTELVPPGQKLNPADLALLAAGGFDTASVHPPVPAALIRSGSEVISTGRPAPGEVRDSFSFLVPPMLDFWGAQLIHHQAVPDDPAAMLATLTSASIDQKIPVIITTGGTGPSDADHLLPVLKDLGAQLLIPAIAMRPGHPTLMARLPSGGLVVGLPGNPLAAVCAAITILEPLLTGFRGEELSQLSQLSVAESIPPLSTKSLTTSGPGPEKIRLIPATVDAAGAQPCSWTGSGMLRGLAAAHCVLCVPAAGVPQGSSVATLPLPWFSAAGNRDVG